MKKRITLIIGIVVFILVIFLINRVIISSDTAICEDFRIIVHVRGEREYVSSDDLKASVRIGYHELQGTNISEINLVKVKEIIEKNPFVKKVKVYKSLDGEIIAEVEQREPLLRLFNASGKAFMIDDGGDVMPVPDNSGLSVICAGGNLNIEPDSFMGASIHSHAYADQLVFKQLNSVFIVASALHSSENFSELISQIYVNEDNEIELIPVIGDFSVFFGMPEQTNEKLDKLHIFYTQLFPYINMNDYRNIDLTISNQLIMKKK
jgi:cell division protein FtsQ